MLGKFFDCSEMNSDLWSNHHSVPLAQYGHYWSSVGGLIKEDDDMISETDSVAYQNGNGYKRVRKVSNIPIGKDSSDEEDEAAHMISPRPVSNDQNGHPFNVGTSGVRDVRIKKTMFQNLSPYRR